MENERIKMVYELLDRNNPVFSTFIVWSCALVVKFLLMATLTSIHRFRTKVLTQFFGAQTLLHFHLQQLLNFVLF